MQKITQTFNYVTAFFSLKQNYFKVGIFAFLFLGFLLLFLYLQKTRILTHKTREALHLITLRNIYQGKGKIKEEKDSLMVKWRKKFVYSRLSHYFNFLNPELWLLIMITMSGMGYFCSILITKNVIYSLIVAGFVFMGLYFGECAAAYYNYKKTDENLFQFLNMLGSFSLTSGEVTTVFGQVAKYVEDPLQSALLECYHEAQTTGNTQEALHSMCEKIEHPKFNEVIRNLENTLRFTSNFKLVVDANRKIIQDYMKAKQDRKAIAAENFIITFIVIIMLIVIMVFMGQLMDTDIWNQLFHTLIGQGCMAVIITDVIWMIWKNYTINK